MNEPHPDLLNAFSDAMRGLPAGMLEYETRCRIRDLIRLHGYEKARELIAGYLLDEANGRREAK